MHVQCYEGYLLQTLECYWPSFAIWSPILAYFLTPQPCHFIFTLVALGKNSGFPGCSWQKFISDPTISFHPPCSYLNKYMEDLSNNEPKIIVNHHGSAPFWATNFHLNDPWILQWELIPPEISETLHMHQKKTQLSTVYPRPSSQRWHSRCPFPPSLPVVLHARALWELSGKDCSVISHNC